MKFTCSKEMLLTSINIVLKAVSTRTTHPILECILIRAKQSRVVLTGNNLELGIESSPIEADVQEEGSIALEARLFSEIIRRSNGNEVSISVDHQNIATITCAASEFKIVGQAGDDFPVLPPVEKLRAYQILQKDLKNMIRQTIFSISQGETKPVLTGELMEIKDGFLSLVSVDGYRISYKKTELTENSEPVSAIIPGKTLNEVGKILLSGEEAALIYLTYKHILFDLGTCIVVSRLIEGEFIRYEQSFTDDYKTKIVLDRNELISSLERASLMSRDARKTPVKLEITENQMIITSNTEIGTAWEQVSIEADGDHLEIGFNPRYLIEALRVIDEERISIQFTTSLSPCIIKGLEDTSCKYLILPLRM